MNLKWTAVRDALAARLRDGSLEPGWRTSIAELAPEFGVSRKTAAKALCALADEGLVKRRPGVGYVVTGESAGAG